MLGPHPLGAEIVADLKKRPPTCVICRTWSYCINNKL